MLINLFVLAIEILTVMIVLKAGFLFPVLESIDFPFYDFCWTVVERMTGSSLKPASASSVASGWLEGTVTLLLYLCLFPLVCKCTEQMFYLGKHLRISAAERLFTQVMHVLTNLFVTALAVGLAQTFILKKIYSLLSGVPALKTLLSIGLILAMLVILFFVIHTGILMFFLWVLVRVLISSSVKFLAIEIFLMYVYYFLNIPGIFEQTGSIIIMIIGILCCLGAVCGSVVVDNRIDDRLERGHLFGYY